ncbi:MAG: hypothetical protein ACJ762_14395 [Solirubrobacteraceae bacterium]
MSPRRLAVLVAFALLAAAPAAGAQPIAIGSPAFAAALGAATGHWGATPCGGQVAYAYRSLPSGVVAYATWLQPANRPADPATFSACRVDVDPAADLGPDLFCTALAHELGHLLGHDHVEDPADLMAPRLGAPLPECVAAMASYEPAKKARKAKPRRRPSKAAGLRSGRVSH